MYTYYPYDVNTSLDPQRVQTIPVPSLQTQKGTSSDHLSALEFIVGEPQKFYVGENPPLSLINIYSIFKFQINTNTDDLVVTDITVQAPDGIPVSFTSGVVDITRELSNPGFGEVTVESGALSTIHLEIEDGLNVPNSATDYSSAYAVFNPFDGSGQELEITVKTNKGDHVFHVDAERYSMGNLYNITLRIEIAEPPVVDMQWSVSTTSADISSFTDVDNNEVTVVTSPTPVYLQIRPETENLDYDGWEIDYTAVPVSYLYPVTTPVGRTERFGFNQGSPHRIAGTYTYTVTELRFYKSGIEVHSVFTGDDPYTHTIQIGESEPVVNVSFQWSVSTTTGEDDAFTDVRDNMVTYVMQPTPVYLRIRPVVDGPLDFDSWEIDYSADPVEYEFPVTPLSAGTAYGFNEENPHLQTGSYIYTVHSFILYKDGRAVLDGWGHYRHTIIIDRDDDPDPPDPPGPPDPDPWPPVLPPDPPVIDPDPNPDAWIFIRPTAPLCYTDREFPVSFVLQYRDDPLEYAVVFTDAAKDAGFEDDSTFTVLPENHLISIPVNGYVPKGDYYGYLVVRIQGTNDTDLFPFRIRVMDYIRITEQPKPVESRCEGDGIAFTVETEGDVLSYQWYRNGEIIPGATDSVYQTILSAETTGSYYAEVNGYCNTEVTDTVHVQMNILKVQLKWADVLYLDNRDGVYTSFQWYKDGQPVTQYGHSVYYTDPNGLLGDYYVRAYKADGSYDESCPLSFITLTRASALSLYPNPVEKNAYFTVQGEELQGAWIEVYDFFGRMIARRQTGGNTIDITAPAISGMYFVKVKLANGRNTTLQVVVKE